jgi:hypothetical protein
MKLKAKAKRISRGDEEEWRGGGGARWRKEVCQQWLSFWVIYYSPMSSLSTNKE